MIAQAVCTSFKLEVLKAIHDFTTDTFKMALYNVSSASLGAATAAYTSTGEITGPGYVAGGLTLARSAGQPAVFATLFAGCRFDDAIWLGATFVADGGLIYNASKANRAVMALAFPTTQSPVAGKFTVRFPASLDPIVNFK